MESLVTWFTSTLGAHISREAIVFIISLFPIPGGVGGAELSFSMVFSTFISGHGKLVLAMLLWRAVTYYLVIFAGIVALAVKPDKIKT